MVQGITQTQLKWSLLARGTSGTKAVDEGTERESSPVSQHTILGRAPQQVPNGGGTAAILRGYAQYDCIADE